MSGSAHGVGNGLPNGSEVGEYVIEALSGRADLASYIERAIGIWAQRWL